MSVDTSGPLGSMPAGTIDAGAVPTCERPNITDTRGFLAWLRTSYPSSLSAQMKGEIVPGTVDGFRASVSAFRSLDGSKGVTFHTFSLPENRCVRLLVKTLGRHMPESVVREELEALGISVQGVMKLRSGRRRQDAARDRPPTPYFVVSVARGPEVQKVRPLSELCGFRVCVETYVAPEAPFNVSAANASAIRSVAADTHPGVLPVVNRTPPGSALPQGSSLNAATAGVTTQQTTGSVQSGRKLRPCLQSGRQLLASTRKVQPVARLQRKRPSPSLLRNRRT
jgi:hypothetical protein